MVRIAARGVAGGGGAEDRVGGDGVDVDGRAGRRAAEVRERSEPGAFRELLVSLLVEGRLEHFALGTGDLAEARLRAQEWSRELVRDGAGPFRLARPREATIAVFWHANPMACTYTTLLTQPARGAGGPVVVRGRGWRVLVVESDPAVRRALGQWLARDPGVARVDGVAQARESVTRGGDWDVVLANREQPAAALRTLATLDGTVRPRLVTHGCFADSDAIFASFSGVSRGYILCRVVPDRLLAPLTDAFPRGRSVGERTRTGRSGGIFSRSSSRVGRGRRGRRRSRRGGNWRSWTCWRGDSRQGSREGAGDQRVDRAQPSESEYLAKYGVRTRTEAVVRHLQK